MHVDERCDAGGRPRTTANVTRGTRPADRGGPDSNGLPEGLGGTQAKEKVMAWLGMNDDEVNAQGNVLQQQAEAIQKLITKVDQEVESLKQNWQGDDSKQFEQEWTGTHRPELQKAQKLLTEMKTTIDREVQQQRETSSQY
jgi:WXG100 family type VII secretion target